jgi:hypothetical protein
MDNLQAISASCSENMPESWPSKEQLLKLAGAISYQSSFAALAIQFIKDPHHGNPISCLDQLIALIDRVDPADDQPFIYVDALYTHILTSVSSDMWPTTHQVLGVLLYGITQASEALQTPKGVSVVLGIELSAVYTALSGCSMIQMPPENAPLENVVFPHASFYDYLVDSAQSKNFYISLDDTRDQVWKLLIVIWQDFKKLYDGQPGELYNNISLYNVINSSDMSMWDEYCSQYHSAASQSNNSAITEFNLNLRHNIYDAPFLLLRKYGPAELQSSQSQDHCFHLLGQLDFTAIVWSSWAFRNEFITWLFEIWNVSQQL